MNKMYSEINSLVCRDIEFEKRLNMLERGQDALAKQIGDLTKLILQEKNGEGGDLL